MTSSFHGIAASTVLLLVAARAAAAPPQIAQPRPMAVAPGSVTELVLTGEGLLGGTQLWTSFPSRCQFSAPADEAATVTRQVQLSPRYRRPRGAGWR
jgi:hypothetical protein